MTWPRTLLSYLLLFNEFRIATINNNDDDNKNINNWCILA